MAEIEIIKILDDLSIEIVVSSKSSNYTCCVFVETTPPGGGPPPHKHLKEEEIFTVLEGEYEFYKDGEWIPMSIGRPILSVRNTYHAFRNVGRTPGRMMLTTNGGGIDDYFRAISGLKMPEDKDRLNEISSHYGYLYLPPS
jgi:quercetin dioxygenase-like cupin family protein